MSRLGRTFFARYTPEVARELLGSVILRRLDAATLQARIVEVEAYRGADDPASHAFQGLTKRNSVMFGEPGHAYVYFTYGNHYCLNVTTEVEGVAGAVLIRATRPLRGIEEMQRRRGVADVTNLMNGPGKLSKAMGIDLSLNGEDLVASKRLFVQAGERPKRVGVSTRVGVSEGKDRKWRFYEEDSPFVSGARTHNYRTHTARGRGVVG